METVAIEVAMLDAMEDAAQMYSTKGVAVVLVLHRDSKAQGNIHFRAIDGLMETNPPYLGSMDRGKNLLAIALSKIAEMVLLDERSGTTDTRQYKKGEVGQLGGDIFKDKNSGLIYYAAFASPEEVGDLDVARNGIWATAN